MVYGTIIQKGEKYYTFLKKLFEAIDNILVNAFNQFIKLFDSSPVSFNSNLHITGIDLFRNIMLPCVLLR